MLGYDIVVLAFACCSWLPQPLEFILAPQRVEAVNEAVLRPMKGRAVAVEVGRAFSEEGMSDPAGRIAGSLATSLADRYGLKFEPGEAPGAGALVLGMQTLEWRIEPAFKDYELRYRGEATFVDQGSGRRLGRAWCDRRVSTGKDSYEASVADRPALAGALQAAATSCIAQLREALIADASPR